METQVEGGSSTTPLQQAEEGSATADQPPGCKAGCVVLHPEKANSGRAALPLIAFANISNQEEGNSLPLSPAACGTPAFATPPRKKPQKYRNSVGGHHLLLSLGDGKVLKECARREEKFYLAFERAMSRRNSPMPRSPGEGTPVVASLPSCQDSTATTPQSATPKALAGAGVEETLVAIANFVPRYYGSEDFPEEDLDLLCESTVNDYSYDRKLRMLRIQDVTYGYEKPCVLDVKMGSRQYGLNAPDRKVESKTRKSRESTSEKLGCRMSGWQKWVAAEGRMVKIDKYQCRTYNEEEFTNALRSFLNYDPALMGKFKQLIDVLKSVFETQNALRLYTSSLLFVYDAARPLDTARIFMVDFAYSYSLDEMKAARDAAASTPRDEGYYLGLQALARALSPSFPSPSTTAPIPVRDRPSPSVRSQPSSLGMSPPPCGCAYDATAHCAEVDVDADTSNSAT